MRSEYWTRINCKIDASGVTIMICGTGRDITTWRIRHVTVGRLGDDEGETQLRHTRGRPEETNWDGFLLVCITAEVIP